jgi:hypothetical protein
MVWSNLQAKGNMGFSAHNSQPEGGSSRPSDRESRPDRDAGGAGRVDAGNAGANDPSLLDVVMQQTLFAESAQEQERLESLEELLQVARRRRGEPFALDPVCIELVQTVLGAPIRALVISEEQWHVMTRQVAQTLCDDPASYDRLSTLWRRLSERCGNGT